MIFLVGAGGCGIDTAAFLCDEIYFVDDYKTGDVTGIPVLYTVDEFIHTYWKMRESPTVYNCLGSEGDNTERNRMYERLTRGGVKVSPLILSSFVSLNVRVGNNVFTNIGSQLHHHVTLEDNVVVSPGAIICGNVTLKRNCFIGTGATVIQDVTINENAIIGAGSVVLKDIPANEMWAGNPAKLIRKW